ncbi:elongation factor P [Candidatus Parcubacteria bacterium]|nr:elongation factor P [Candidatus Parcubacteria bacterium]
MILKKGTIIIIEKTPYEIISASPLFKGRGHSVLQTKLKNLISGNVISKTIRGSENFEEAEIKKIQAKFLYSHREKFFFCGKDNPSFRFDIAKEIIGEASKFLKPNQIIEAILFKDKIINISLPIKINFKVIEAPPGIKGNRAEAGTKIVTLETGTQISVPLFIEQGDIIEVNTEAGEYVRRIDKE